MWKKILKTTDDNININKKKNQPSQDKTFNIYAILCSPVFFMALVMLLRMELIFPRSTLARFKGAGLTVVMGVVTVDKAAV